MRIQSSLISKDLACAKWPLQGINLQWDSVITGVVISILPNDVAHWRSQRTGIAEFLLRRKVPKIWHVLSGPCQGINLPWNRVITGAVISILPNNVAHWRVPKDWYCRISSSSHSSKSSNSGSLFLLAWGWGHLGAWFLAKHLAACMTLPDSWCTCGAWDIVSRLHLEWSRRLNENWW